MYDYDSSSYKKITMNLPMNLYNELKKESHKLGVNLTALVIMKLNQLKEQQNTIEILAKATELSKMFDKMN